MRLMKKVSKDASHSSPCSKAELVAGIGEALGQEAHRYPPLDKCTRSHLIDIADEIGVLIDLEQRSRILRILKAAKIDFDPSEPTYVLVNLGIDKAIEKYGIADLDSLGKNLKKSPLSAYGTQGTSETSQCRLQDRDG